MRSRRVRRNERTLSLPKGRRALLLAVIICLSVACRGGGLIRQYQYEEDVYLDLDGSATVVVNASVPALIALAGLDLPADAGARLDRDRVRAAYESEATDVRRVSRPWRRAGRRFVQIRMAVRDIRKLPSAKPFAWSDYSLTETPDTHVFKQVVRGMRARLRPAPDGMAASSSRSGCTCRAASTITTCGTSRPTRPSTSSGETSSPGSSG